MTAAIKKKEYGVGMFLNLKKKMTCCVAKPWNQRSRRALVLLFARTPLHYAAASRHYQCLETLVACGTAINATDQWERSALHYAAASDLDRR